MLNEQQVNCPYCGEQILLLVDTSQGDHDTIEDCWVCCRPIEIRVDLNSGARPTLAVGTTDDPPI